MRRLSVKAAHLEACIEKSVFALGPAEKKPDVRPGELLLLQLSKVDADKYGMQERRTNFVLVLDRIEEDPDAIKQLWPDARSNHDWHWLLYGSHTIPAIPFSTPDSALELSQSYSKRGQSNPAIIIEKVDEEKIQPYILGVLAEKPDREHQWADVPQIIQKFGKQRVLSAIYNHDDIVRSRAKSGGGVNKEKCEPNLYLAEILALYYEHRCQICGKNPFYDYGVACSEAHYIQPLAQGGLDVSTNIVILCPNHRRIIQTTNASFVNSSSFAFDINGRREPLKLDDHFKKQDATVLERIRTLL